MSDNAAVDALPSRRRASDQAVVVLGTIYKLKVKFIIVEYEN